MATNGSVVSERLEQSKKPRLNSLETMEVNAAGIENEAGHCSAHDTVMNPVSTLPDGYTEPVKGYDFNKGIDYKAILQSYKTTGFQATNFDAAVHEINRMLKAKYDSSEDSSNNLESAELNLFQFPPGRPKTGCTIFLGYTSNIISSGLRDVIRFLVQHNMVDCLVTTAGGIEEDFIKCLAPTILGDFTLPGAELRKRGVNRVGNLLIPNANYCLFEDWIFPILDKLVQEQLESKVSWTPCSLIWRLGKEINNPESVYYWAYVNKVPVFCPGLTDGSLGDMLYFHSYRSPGLTLDILEDLKNLNNLAVHSHKTGMIIVGGGLVKHHICNANLMRNGAEYSVFINTAQEFDGSDSGAKPDEAVSWGKIKADATPVKVYAEATLVFPLIVAETFATYHFRNNR